MIIAISKQAGKTFLRFSVLYRSIKYRDACHGGIAYASGQGMHFHLKTMLGEKSYLMAQLLAGSGISASYTLSGSLFGNNAPSRPYDALYDQDNNFKTIPIYGGSLGTEVFYGKEKRMHSNVVLGYTTQPYQATPSSLAISKLVEDNHDNDFVRQNSNSTTTIAYPFGTINVIYDVLKEVKVQGLSLNFTVGLEYNVGAKTIINEVTHSAMVNRVAFGLMFGF